jgi:hypothetical protein
MLQESHLCIDLSNTRGGGTEAGTFNTVFFQITDFANLSNDP